MRIRYWSSDVCSSDLFARGFAEFAIETIERRTEIGRGAAVAQLVETKHLLVQRLRRARIVPIEAFAEIDAYQDDLRPSPEREAGGRIDYDRLLALRSEEHTSELQSLMRISYAVFCLKKKKKKKIQLYTRSRNHTYMSRNQITNDNNK